MTTKITNLNMDVTSITQLGTLEGLTSGGLVNFSTATSVNLGNIQNVKIAGGSSGQVIVTDGTGNLQFGAGSISKARVMGYNLVFGG